MELEKVTIRLFKGDREALEALFPNTGYNLPIRQCVRKLVRHLQEKQAQAVDSLGDLEISISTPGDQP